MRQTNSALSGKGDPHTFKALTGFGLLSITGICLSASALVSGQAPLHTAPQLSDWIRWLQVDGMTSGLTVFFAILGLIGLTGLGLALLPQKVQTADQRPNPLMIAESISPISAEDASDAIGVATETALLQWPDATRPIAASELGTRLAQLYHDPSSESRTAFAAIRAGDLKTGVELLKTQAEQLAPTQPDRAANLWRIYGALHMGREDAQALQAYAQVSALDASDTEVHLYMIHRYEIAGQTNDLLPVIGRALAVAEDPAIRSDLLNRQAELAQAAEDWGTTATALEGICIIRADDAEADPENLRKRSAHALSLARLAQARERLGYYPKAGPLYRQAHEMFAELSAKIPEHQGLKAMAENAHRDAQRFRA
ncbi:MAG: hypothetical protein QM645_09970 [Asticcacaulis sp.]